PNARWSGLAAPRSGRSSTWWPPCDPIAVWSGHCWPSCRPTIRSPSTRREPAMATSDALLVVEDWISEHYFTTDARGESFGSRVTALRKTWDAADESVRSRFTSARPALVNEFARLDPGDRASGEAGSDAGTSAAAAGHDLHDE